MKNQLFVSQLISDLVFPILGFLFWDWSVYFILLFVLLDLLCDLVVTFVKASKILKFQGESGKLPLKYFVLVLFFLTSTIVSLHLLMVLHQPGIHFGTELLNFWNYQDMGIPQGYFLAPLLILMAMQQYKIEFQMPALYRTQKQDTLWKNHFQSYYWYLAFAGVGVGLVQLWSVSELVLFILLILVLLLRSVSARFLQPTR